MKDESKTMNLTRLIHHIEDCLEVMENELMAGNGVSNKFDRADEKFKQAVYGPMLPKKFVDLYEQEYEKITSQIKLDVRS